MADFAVGVRISADGSGLAGQLKSDSAEVKRLTDELTKLSNVSPTVERATRSATQAVDAAGKSMRQTRNATQDLGYQINDFGTQVLGGTDPLRAFTQQIGQVAFALSGLNGAAGAVGTFLAGPWGAALTIAALGLAALYEGSQNNAEGHKKHKEAADLLTESIKKLDEASGRLKKTEEEVLAEGIAATNQKLADTKATRDQISARLALNRAILSADQANTAGIGSTMAVGASNLGANLAQRRIDELNVQGKANDVAQSLLEQQKRAGEFATSLVDVKAKLDPVVAATRAFNVEMSRLAKLNDQSKISASDLSAAQEKAVTTLQAVKDANKNAASANREHNKELRDQASAAKEAAKELDALSASLAANLSANLAFLNKLESGGVAAYLKEGGAVSIAKLRAKEAADAQTERTTDDLSGLSGGLTTKRLGLADPADADEFGHKAADSFQTQLTEAAGAIGKLIGGSTGSAIGKALGAVQGLGSLGKGSSPFAKAFADSNKKLFDQVTGKLDSVFNGSGGSGGFGAKAGAAFAGAAQGAIAGNVLKGLGVKSSSAGSALGGGLGGVLSQAGGALSFLGPFGGILGGLAGGLLGGLFKKTKSGSATIGNVDGESAITGTGGNSASYQKAASGLADGVGGALQNIVDALGGDLGQFSVSIGQRKKKFVVDPSGSGKTKGSGVQKYDTQEEASAAALRNAIADGAVTGISAAVARALQSSTDIDKAVNTALKVQQVEDLIGGFASASQKAFSDFEKQAADRLKIATQYGFDVVKLEKINGEQRVALYDQILEAQTGSLKSLLASINGGDLFEGSAVDKRNAIQANVDQLRKDSAAGVEGANDKLAQALSDLVTASKDAFGTGGGQYAGDRANTISIAQQVIDQANSDLKAAQKAATDALPAKVDATNALLNEGNNQTAQLLAAYNLNTATLGSLLSGVYGAGVGKTSAAIGRQAIR